VRTGIKCVCFIGNKQRIIKDDDGSKPMTLNSFVKIGMFLLLLLFDAGHPFFYQ